MVILASLVIAGASPWVQPKEPPRSEHPCAAPPGSRYDYDLFHKDVECVFAEAEFLYWTVNEGALDYAIKMNQPAGVTPSYAIGKVNTAGFKLSPGVRLSVGYFNAPKYWDVCAQYTHLISRGKNRVEPPKASGEFLTGTWPQLVSGPLVHAHSRIFFDYNLFDLWVDRIFNPNPHLRIRAGAAACAAWIHQDWKVQYFDSTSFSTLRNQWHFIGGGLATGLQGDWYWGNNIYLTGKYALTAYIGSYRNTAKETVSLSGGEALVARDSNYSDTRPALSVQFSMGPSWQQNFGCHRIELWVGYEVTSWLNLQEMHRSSSATLSSAPKETWQSTSMLAVQGLTTRLTVDF
jgi:hypothetical protein